MNVQWRSDARKIPDEAMDYIRQIAVQAIVDRRYSPEMIADVFNISRSAIYRWLAWFRKEGETALLTQKAPGAERKITPKIDLWLKHTILNSTPYDHGFDTELWTLKILASLLEKTFSIHVYQSTIANHLHRMKLSCQVPRYRAYGYNQHEVDHFISKKWPIIQRVASRMGAEIGFEDEAGIGMMTRSGRSWGAVNSPPIVPANDRRGGYNALSTITLNGMLYYQIEEGHIGSDQYIAFLEKMLSQRQKPIILVVDNVKFHRSKKVRQFVRAHRDKIRVFFLPRHAPNLNPDEQVWNEIKHRHLGREPILDKEDLFDRLMIAFNALKKNTDRILSFFHLPDTRYTLGISPA